MATIGALNRRLDKVEAAAATIGGRNAQAFDLYALSLMLRWERAEGFAAIAEILPSMFPNAVHKQISDASQALLSQARNEARAAIRAAGETEITGPLLEQAFFYVGSKDTRAEWSEANRDGKRPPTISAWFPCVALCLYGRVTMGEATFQMLLSGND